MLCNLQENIIVDPFISSIYIYDCGSSLVLSLLCAPKLQFLYTHPGGKLPLCCNVMHNQTKVLLDLQSVKSIDLPIGIDIIESDMQVVGSVIMQDYGYDMSIKIYNYDV